MVLGGRRLPRILSVAGLGSLSHILCIGFCYLKGVKNVCGLEGKKKRKYIYLPDSFLAQQWNGAYNPICLHKCEHNVCVVNKYSSGAYSQSAE